MTVILVKPERDILSHLTKGPIIKETIKNSMFVDRLIQHGFISTIVKNGRPGYIALTDTGFKVLKENDVNSLSVISQPFVSLCDEYTNFQKVFPSKTE